jgi:lipoprotein-releasing system permease protein
VAGERYTTTTWMERNKQLLGALKMERIVTIIVIGLIELVAALNILHHAGDDGDGEIPRHRGADVDGRAAEQIRRIFMLQGVLIGVVGSAIGLVAGYTLCYFAEKYRWIPLDESVYSMSFVPFEPHWADGVWIAGAGGPGELPGDHLPGQKRHAHHAGGSAAVRVATRIGP